MTRKPREFTIGSVVFLLLLLAGAAHAAAVDFLLAAATDEELHPLLARLEDKSTETHGAWTFWTGTVAGKQVAIARTEGDPLNSVAATTLGIRLFQPRLVLTFGAARALDPALKPGDAVVSASFVAFDGSFTPVSPLGDGSNPLTWFRLPHAPMTRGEKETPAETFPADSVAVAEFTRLAASNGRTVAITLGSANQVNREADRVAWLREKWGVSTEDAESAFVAGTALLFGAPVAGLRVIDGKPGEAGAIVLKFLEARK